MKIAGQEEFVLLVARRDGGSFDIVAPVSDAKLVEQAIRKTG
jgi:hypothetical protein